MPDWLFQGNPDHFDMDTYFATREVVQWTVQQRHLADEMEVGQTVFFWRAGGRRSNSIAGVVAQGEVIAPPAPLPDEAPELWNPEHLPSTPLRIRVRLTSVNTTPRRVVKRTWLEKDPILAHHRIFKLRTETNYRLTGRESARLADLVRRTGRSWTPEESLAGLWAYKETKDGPISRAPETPISAASLRIGRTVTGVYDKVLNFRALDPTDSRQGLSSVSEADRVVWGRYFDPEHRVLDTEAIDRDFLSYWSATAEPAPIFYTGFGPPPPNDPDALQQFARRVRYGQRPFRDSLLELYGSRCAVTGSGPYTVLEACHIASHAETGLNHPDNGLLLRADIHHLFDAGLLRIDPQTLAITISSELDGTAYESLRGTSLRERSDGGRPAARRLRARWHNRT